MNISRLSKQNTLKPQSRKQSPFQKLPVNRRPLSHIKSSNSIREKEWNNRFIYNKMPLYDSAKDKNVFHPQKMKLSNKTINTILSAKTRNFYKTNYQNKSNIFKPVFNRTNSGFYTHNSKDSKINSYNNINLNTQDENIEKSSEIKELSKLWNELLVPRNYRNLFIIIYKQLIGEERQNLYKKELNELNNINNNIKTLKYYLNLRSGILKELYNLSKKLGYSLGNYKNNGKPNEEMLKEISEKIEKLRESTVDVCFSMKKFKTEINIVQNLGKYNIDRLSYKFKIDKNYLIKMKSEISFIKEGYVKYFFNVNDDQTPFLLKMSDSNLINEKESFVHLVPLKNELKEDIIECNYYIYQELIAYQNSIINNNNNNKFENTFFNNSKNANSYKFGNQSIYKNNECDLLPDMNSFNNSNIFDAEIKHNKFQNIINQRIFSAKYKKDLFSQKLLSGFENEIEDKNIIDLPDEDEKIQKSKENEEEEDNEEEEEEENEKEEKNGKNEKISKKILIDKSENDANNKINKIPENEISFKGKEKDLNNNVEKVIYEEKETIKENKDTNEKNNCKEKMEKGKKENDKIVNNNNTENNKIKNDKIDYNSKMKNESNENYKINNNKIESIKHEDENKEDNNSKKEILKKEENKIEIKKSNNNKIENDRKIENKVMENEKINKTDDNNNKDLKKEENEKKDVNKKNEDEKLDAKNINDELKKENDIEGELKKESDIRHREEEQEDLVVIK